MSSVGDIRGFHYVLQPVLMRQRWQCDRLGVKLALLHRNIASAEAQRQADERLYQERLGQLRALLARSLDTYWYRQQLNFLGQQQQMLDNQKKVLVLMQAQKRALMQQYIQAQRKTEAISGHKTDQLHEHVLAAQSRQQSEDDREWAGRRLWLDVR
jgi:hypothetical protein